jgi:hypothetical protein
MRITRQPAAESLRSLRRSSSNALRVVERVAVELDDQPLVVPGGVDLHSLDAGVRLGQREVEGVQEGEELGLELASG